MKEIILCAVPSGISLKFQMLGRLRQEMANSRHVWTYRVVYRIVWQFNETLLKI